MEKEKPKKIRTSIGKPSKRILRDVGEEPMIFYH
jgi:hypothetical protein